MFNRFSELWSFKRVLTTLFLKERILFTLFYVFLEEPDGCDFCAYYVCLIFQLTEKLDNLTLCIKNILVYSCS
jgi:hypothetical protein